MRLTENYVLFFSSSDICSNFYPCKIKDPESGHEFFCTEQYFMWRKAMFFGDLQMANKILKVTTAKEAKRLGREVKPYSDSAWNLVRERVMFKALCLKFEQHKPFRDLLTENKNKIFVEASPYDRLWGVGLGENDPLVLNPKYWRGKNKLGSCIKDVIRKYLS